MGFASLDVQAEKHGVIMDEGNFSASSDDDVSSVGSMDSDDDSNNNSSSEVNYSPSSSPNSPFSYKSSPPGHRPSAAGDSLNDMSTLLQQLPFKRRGLSKHYEGKSQSFTCLSNVRCLEDLAKSENPYNKKLKSCKSYVGLYGESQRSSSNQQMNSSIPKRLISKKTSRASCSSLVHSAKRNNSRPPIHPPSYRSSNTTTNFCNQTHPPLFV